MTRRYWTLIGPRPTVVAPGARISDVETFRVLRIVIISVIVLLSSVLSTCCIRLLTCCDCTVNDGKCVVYTVLIDGSVESSGISLVDIILHLMNDLQAYLTFSIST